jgi:RNA polymerase sigma-70 factor (ECF subfamily)
MEYGSGTSARRGRDARFAATRWSLVLAAAEPAENTDSRRALEDLLGTYWFPLYAFLRRRGETASFAEDMVQAFFARLLEKQYLAQADPARGRFRSFMLAALKHFVANERAKLQTLKRGGGHSIVSIDAAAAEARYAVEPVDEVTPEMLFDRRWALTVLDTVLGRLGEEYAAKGKADLYAAIEPCLTHGAVDHADVAGQLDMTEGAVRVATHRLRRRYRDLLRAEIVETVASPEEVDEEITYLLKCL